MSGQPMIPVDEGALLAIEHALGGSVSLDEAGERHLEGAEYTLDQLLRFWADFDPSMDVIHTGYIEDIPLYHGTKPCFTEHDLIRALVAEVRRLRNQEAP